MPKIIEDQTVFEAVLQTIAERGYAGATTRQMADAAGVSEVTLFRKYESKPNLVQLAISAIAEQADFEKAVRYTGDVRADLLRILHAYYDSVVQRGSFFIVLFSEISRTPELADSVEEPLKIYSTIGEIVSQYQQEGILIKENPRHVVASLLGPLIFSTLVRIPSSEDFMPPLDLEIYVSNFLNGHMV